MTLYSTATQTKKVTMSQRNRHISSLSSQMTTQTHLSIHTASWTTIKMTIALSFLSLERVRPTLRFKRRTRHQLSSIQQKSGATVNWWNLTTTNTQRQCPIGSSAFNICDLATGTIRTTTSACAPKVCFRCTTKRWTSSRTWSHHFTSSANSFYWSLKKTSSPSKSCHSQRRVWLSWYQWWASS